MNEQFGKDVLQSDLFNKTEVDGNITIDWRESELDRENKRIMALYTIRDKNDNIVKEGGINYYTFPGEYVNYIVCMIAKNNNIHYPSNLLLQDGEFMGCGTAQINLDAMRKEPKFTKYKHILERYIS